MARQPLLGRIVWFAGIWFASVLALTLVAYIIRLAIAP